MTRSLLKAHTADLADRPRWEQYQQALGDLVTTAHDPDASDEQAEAAALAFLEEWGNHPVHRKTARYGLILHALRHRPELTYRLNLFSRHVGGIEDWYRHYTGALEAAA